MTKAYSYIRFSSSIQHKGDSLRRQTELSEKYAKEHNLDLDWSLNLKDLGISAFDGSNRTKGALGEFLQLVNDGKIPKGSYLLVESLDRLSRDKVLEAFSVFTSILTAGITIVTLTDNQVFTYESANYNFNSLLISLSTMFRANEESQTKSKRIRASWDNKRNNIDVKILTGRCPYWLRPSDNKTNFELIENRVDVVKRIYEMAKEGYGNSLIVKTLNNEGIPTFSKLTDGWQASYIQKLLMNPAVYGEITLKLQRDGKTTIYQTIPNYYPPIMTRSEWIEVNSVRSSRKVIKGINRGDSLSNLFSGLLKCAYCKGPMNMGANTKKKNSNQESKKYVACSRARRGLECKFIKWDYIDLENQILTFCKSVDYHKIIKSYETEIESRVVEQEQHLNQLKDKCFNTKIKLNNLIQILEDQENTTLPKTLLERMNNLEMELEKYESEVVNAEIQLNKLKIDAKNQEESLQDSINIIDTLSKTTGTQLFDLRVRLSSKLKRSIKEIYLSPGGSWRSIVTTTTLEQIYDDEEGSERLKKYFNSQPSFPNKNERSFLISFLNGTHKSVHRGSSLEISNAFITDFAKNS
jgi:DNA invertase Pin-like site-specific DNA recombinase